VRGLDEKEKICIKSLLTYNIIYGTIPPMVEGKSFYNAWDEIQNKHKIPVRPKFSFDNNFGAQIGFFYRKKEISNDIVINAINSVGIIEETDKCSTEIGTCFVIRNNDNYFIASALHCFLKNGDSRHESRIHFENGKELIIKSNDVEMSIKNIDNDVIFFRIPKIDGVEGINVSERKLKNGKMVFAIGHPGNYKSYRYLHEPLISIGKVISPTEIHIRCEQGNSGSPVLNTKGELIGIEVSGTEYVEEMFSYMQSRSEYSHLVSHKICPVNSKLLG
jgi:hypothetical protein